MGLEVISSTVGNSVLDFIDYSLILVILISVYQLFKMVTFSAAGSEAPDSNEPNKIKEWLKKNKEKAKLTDEQKKREHILGATKGYIIWAEQKIEKAIEELDDRNSDTIANTKNLVLKIKEHLREAKRRFHFAKMNTKNNHELREKLTKAGAGAQSIYELVQRGVEEKLPANESVSNWDQIVTDAKNILDQARGHCGVLVVNIDKYVEEGSLDEINF
jgi:hypothetical protein